MKTDFDFDGWRFRYTDIPNLQDAKQIQIYICKYLHMISKGYKKYYINQQEIDNFCKSFRSLILSIGITQNLPGEVFKKDSHFPL